MPNLQDGILFHKPCLTSRDSQEFAEQIAIPGKLKTEILHECHDSVFGGHHGFQKTLNKVQMRFYWPQMRKEIEQYCTNCILCNNKKGPWKKSRAPLNPIPITGAFDRVAIDVLQLPTSSSGNRVVIVFTDYLTKWTEAFASSDAKAITIAKLFMEKLVIRFGCPLEILTDRGKNFQSKLLLEICNLCNVHKISTSSYHPETNGLVERFNRTLCNMLAMYVAKQQDDWDFWLPYCLFAYNTAKQSSTGESPYFLLYGHDPRMPLDVAFNALRARTIPWCSDYARYIASNLTEAHQIAVNNISKAQRTQKNQYDKKVYLKKISPGDLVYLWLPQLKRGQVPKLSSLWSGPYQVIDIQLPSVLILNSQNKKNKVGCISIEFTHLRTFTLWWHRCSRIRMDCSINSLIRMCLRTGSELVSRRNSTRPKCPTNNEDNETLTTLPTLTLTTPTLITPTLTPPTQTL